MGDGASAWRPARCTTLARRVPLLPVGRCAVRTAERGGWLGVNGALDGCQSDIQRVECAADEEESSMWKSCDFGVRMRGWGRLTSWRYAVLGFTWRMFANCG